MSILRKLFGPFLLLTLLVCNIFSFAQTSASREYQIKSVFLFNFTQFVEWPADAFSSPQAPLVIGVVGKDPFGSYLKEIVSGEQVNGHSLLVQHYTNVEDIMACHILFINLTDAKQLEQVLASLKEKSILTVSDASNFLQQGGMIRFFTKNNKIQLQINLETAKEANLVISSKLLRLAEIFVSPKKN